MSDTPWNAALNLLARREYSQFELRRKLSQRFPEEPEAIETALQRLIDTGLQDDQRFAEAFFRSQVNRSRGPVRIRHDARQKGIQENIDRELSLADIDWYELAFAAGQRKLGADDPRDPKIQARIARFLAYRGFDSDQVRTTLERLREPAD